MSRPCEHYECSLQGGSGYCSVSSCMNPVYQTKTYCEKWPSGCVVCDLELCDGKQETAAKRIVQCKNCVNLKDDWCDKKKDSPDPDLNRDCQFFRVATNADRLRAKSDEELADVFCSLCCPFRYGYKGECKGEKGCFGCWLDWLKQEAIER